MSSCGHQDADWCVRIDDGDDVITEACGACFKAAFGYAPTASQEDTAYGYTFSEWLKATGRSDSASDYDLRAAWRAGEDPADYTMTAMAKAPWHWDPGAPEARRDR